MDPKTSKRLSWTLSILIHSVLAIIIVKASLHYILPEGEVTTAGQTSTTSFEVVQGDNKPSEAAAPTNPAAPVETKQNAAPHAHSAKHSAAHDNVKFLPDKNFNDVQPQDTADASDVTVTPPAKLADPVTEEEPAAIDEAPVSEATPVEESHQPEASIAEAPTPEASGPEKVAGTGDASDANAKNANAAAPAYGTPGSMVDETKLVERAGNRNPSYPWMARIKRQEGTVVVRAFIRPDGRVDLPILEKSSGSPLLDQEALKSYALWRYQPGVSGWVSKPFKFNLK